VRDDWRAWLPESKSRLNDQFSKELETLYSIFSVSLDEALELRRTGSIAKALELAHVSQGVCRRFSQTLEMLLSTLHRHAKHFGLVPNAAPLDAGNFRGPRSQRAARIAGFLNRVLLSQRSQFIHKAATLRDLVNDLNGEFSKAADDLTSGEYLENEGFWDALDKGHFDLNTCLRESIVLLKSFLVVLPDEQVTAFEAAVSFSLWGSALAGPCFPRWTFRCSSGKIALPQLTRAWCKVLAYCRNLYVSVRIAVQLRDNSKGDSRHPTVWMHRNWTVGPKSTNRAQTGSR